MIPPGVLPNLNWQTAVNTPVAHPALLLLAFARATINRRRSSGPDFDGGFGFGGVVVAVGSDSAAARKPAAPGAVLEVVGVGRLGSLIGVPAQPAFAQARGLAAGAFGQSVDDDHGAALAFVVSFSLSRMLR